MKGSTNACKTRVFEKLASLATAASVCVCVCVVFPNGNLVSSIRRVEGIVCGRICQQELGVWSPQTHRKEALSPPLAQGRRPQATASKVTL